MTAIVARCVADLRAHGIDQWDDVYPNEEVLNEDVRSGTLYVAEENGIPIAAVCLNDDQPDQYRSVPWRCAEGRALVVHRLCVDPVHQRRGLGRRLMEFAGEFARRRGYRSIRLEVYSNAPAALALYSRLGYVCVGQIRFPRRRLPFNCLELILDGRAGPGQLPPSTPNQPSSVAPDHSSGGSRR